jgi:ribonuclease BN (tRNA processing enzyme)
VPFEQFPATISFTEVSEDTWQIDDLRVATVPVCHPGSTVGYRLSQNGNSLAYIPDNEPALDRRAGLAVAEGADVLFHDAQFTDAEYQARVGWGHSALSDFVRYLDQAVPARAVMFHHDPAHSDAALEAMLADVQAAVDGQPVELAHEGLELKLGSH